MADIDATGAGCIGRPPRCLAPELVRAYALHVTVRASRTVMWGIGRQPPTQAPVRAGPAWDLHLLTAGKGELLSLAVRAAYGGVPWVWWSYSCCC